MSFRLKPSLVFNKHVLRRFAFLPRNFHAECLKNRSLISVEGEESVDFLQGLMTNDMTHLEKDGSCMYTMFLNVQGRVLFEANIFRKNADIFLLDCDRNIVPSAIRHLKAHMVRRKINVNPFSAYNIWAVFKNNINLNELDSNDTDVQIEQLTNYPESALVTLDPKLRYLGDRILLPIECSLEGVDGITTTVGDYELLRYKLGVGEGCLDFVPGKTLPLQANCDYLHGVSFQKGCYIGQELTARSFHTGVIRRRYMPIQINNGEDPIDSNSNIINEKGRSVGKVINICRGYGIGLMRIEECSNASSLSVSGFSLSTFIPGWWPSDT